MADQIKSEMATLKQKCANNIKKRRKEDSDWQFRECTAKLIANLPARTLFQDSFNFIFRCEPRNSFSFPLRIPIVNRGSDTLLN